jgi:hypothetical protein
MLSAGRTTLHASVMFLSAAVQLYNHRPVLHRGFASVQDDILL